MIHCVISRHCVVSHLSALCRPWYSAFNRYLITSHWIFVDELTLHWPVPKSVLKHLCSQLKSEIILTNKTKDNCISIRFLDFLPNICLNKTIITQIPISLHTTTGTTNRNKEQPRPHATQQCVSSFNPFFFFTLSLPSKH